MDDRDKKILHALIRDSRTSYVELARQLHISEAAVRKRVKNLEEGGVIQHFTIKVDPAALGYGSVAIIGLDAEPSALAEVYGSLGRLKNVKYVSLSAGDHMIMFEAWCKNQKELKWFISSLKRMPGVTKICPAILLANQ